MDAVCSILVIDDSQEVCDVVARAYNGPDHQVDIVNNEKDALDKIRFRHYDFIMIDLMLHGTRPDIRVSETSGYNFLRQTDTNGSMVIVMTGLAVTSKDRALLLSAGALWILEKPMDMVELDATIDRGIRHRRQLRLDFKADAKSPHDAVTAKELYYMSKKRRTTHLHQDKAAV